MKVKLALDKSVTDWLTARHLLVIRDEDNFAEKTRISFTFARLIVLATASVAILFSVSFILSNTILSRWFHPASREVEINKRLIELSASVDSLSGELQNRDLFLTGMDRVLKGDQAFMKTDPGAGSKQANAVATKPKTGSQDLQTLSRADLDLRKEFENGNGITSSGFGKSTNNKDVFLFAPITGGIVSARYNPKIAHYGVDVVSRKDEPIKNVADGTVVLSSWTNDTGYIIAVQHKNNLISVYKHNSVLLKKTGNFVKAGEIIAIIGNTGELTTGPHLHFELWNNGNPVDPEQFVSF